MIGFLTLISVGIGFIAIELFTLSFVAIFFGFGFIIAGIISYFIYIEWYLQILIAFVISFVLLLTLKKPIKEYFNKSSNLKDNFLDEKGEGVIKDKMVYYKGTYFQADNIDEFSDGERVEILEMVENSKVKIRSIKN
ncbi:MAG: NfeD family protein [Campylobacter sp.]|nr:NfeD family protein [Campylobacter sp.]